MKSMSRLFLMLSLFLISCEEIIEWTPSGNAGQRLVVEAILTDEFKPQEIVLSGISNEINESPEGISGAFISVNSGSENYLFWEDPEIKGRYVSAQAFAIEPNKPYLLSIDWMQNQYHGQATAVEGLPMRSFAFLPYQETDSLYIGGIGVEYSVQEQAMYEFIIDWSEITGGGKTQAKLIHYVFNSINIGQLFGPDQEQIVFPRGSTVYLKKYSLDPGFAEYLRSLVIETRWKGGFFEESSGNLPTNLSGGALGYFAACALQSDTLIAK